MAKQAKNLAKDKIHLNSFIGGQSIDYKYGITNSFYDAKGLDFRSKASQMTVLPGMTATASNLKDLITAMVQDKNGVRWAIGNQGYLYRIATSGTITNVAKLDSNGAAGIVYNQQTDQLYISGQQTISTYGPLSTGTPVFRSGNFTINASNSFGTVNIYDASTNAWDIARNNMATVSTATGAVNLNNYSTLITNTLSNNYILPNSIIETSINLSSFIPDIEPFYSIAVYITTKGTGNMTLTLHDSFNNTLASSTITNANLKTGWNNFVFSTPGGVRAVTSAYQTGFAGQGQYHFHLSSSVLSDSTAVGTYASNDMSGVNMILFAYRMVQTTNGWHPMTTFTGKLCIGNGNYLSTYDFSNDNNPDNAVSGTHGYGWDRHAIPLDFGYEVCGLTVNNQYLVIAAEKRSSNNSTNFQDGYLYFWDGSNSLPNFKIEIPMGAPYSLTTLNNVTYFVCGGSLFAWGGGQQVIKVRYLAYQNTDYLNTYDKTIVNPNMMDVRYNLLMIGYPSTTTNYNINYGIYSWGSVELTYPNSFGYSYASSLAPSLGYVNSSSLNMQLGMIKNFVDAMYMSWQYTDSNSITHYGLDIVNNSSTPAPSFSWTSLIWDGGVRYKRKKGLRLKINFLPLPTGCTLQIWYSIDRGTQIIADPLSGTVYQANPGDVSIVIELNNARFYELQWGFYGTNTTATSPAIITGITAEIDPLEDEASVRQDHA